MTHSVEPRGAQRATMTATIAATALFVCGALLLWTPPAAAEGPPVTVSEARIQPVVRILPVSGTVTSPRSALLSPSVGGLIDDFAVDAGDTVAAGDILVSLDDELVELALERAGATLAEAEAGLADARRRLAEAERLGSERGIPETEIESRRAEVATDEAALQAASAAFRQQQAVVRRHEIRAPFAGAVARRLAEVGEWVNPGDGLLELVAVDGLRYDFRVPQNYYADISPDTLIDISPDAAPEESIPGDIIAIVPVNDPAARTFLLRAVAAEGHSLPVTPGMSARGALHLDTGRKAVVVPRDALIRYPDGRITVWELQTGGDAATVSEQRVETGLEFDGLVEIVSGIGADTRVVTRGNEALQNGQTVTVTRD
ncbi:efflux RND transporter periplasmic adaptor subunit [Lentisalinibacter salinarum]|uniref:efflux RND transporter periplasmic adaptor subunit n=1 Tax=Lentisalinibacter salinarum TaxID=2992239 RepID=UPI003862D82E